MQQYNWERSLRQDRAYHLVTAHRGHVAIAKVRPIRSRPTSDTQELARVSFGVTEPQAQGACRPATPWFRECGPRYGGRLHYGARSSSIYSLVIIWLQETFRTDFVATSTSALTLTYHLKANRIRREKYKSPDSMGRNSECPSSPEECCDSRTRQDRFVPSYV